MKTAKEILDLWNQGCYQLVIGRLDDLKGLAAIRVYEYVCRNLDTEQQHNLLRMITHETRYMGADHA